jgi:hypothetical protein
MANGFYHKYPDAPTGIAAGREFVRLFTSGEFGQDGQHTTNVIWTTAGGAAGVYPGYPGAGISAASGQAQQQSPPPALTVEEDQLYNEIEQKVAQAQAAAKAHASGQPHALAFDPTPWIPLLLALLEMIRRRRNPTP